jgi:hypothetical protein
MIRNKWLLAVILGLSAAVVATAAQGRPEYVPPKVLSNTLVTERFRIYTDLDSDTLDYYKLFFNGFFDYFEANYFKINQTEPITIFLFKDQNGYKPYVKTIQRFYTPYGFYLGQGRNLIVVNRESGLGTMTHELVHYFIDTSFARRPPKWINEGIATFFEKFIGHFDENGKLIISFGYFSNWRFPQTKRKIGEISLEKLMKSDEPDESAARSIMLFLHKKKLLGACIEKWRVEMTEPTGVRDLERVYGKPIDEFEADWKKWVRAQPIDENVNLVPTAFVLRQKEWDKWLSENGNRLYWDDEDKLYKARK